MDFWDLWNQPLAGAPVGGVHSLPRYWEFRQRAKRSGKTLTLNLYWQYVVRDSFFAPNALYYRLAILHDAAMADGLSRPDVTLDPGQPIVVPLRYPVHLRDVEGQP